MRENMATYIPGIYESSECEIVIIRRLSRRIVGRK